MHAGSLFIGRINHLDQCDNAIFISMQMTKSFTAESLCCCPAHQTLSISINNLLHLQTAKGEVYEDAEVQASCCCYLFFARDR